MSNSTTVLKVGGSLFDLPEFASRLREYLDTEAGGVVIVAGGGRFADEIRRLQQIHNFSNEIAHNLAINTMSTSARLLGEILQLPVIHSWSEIAGTFSRNQIAVLDVSLKVFNEGEAHPRYLLDGLHELPASWDVTSDSIAAWVAIRSQAERLILGKSVSLPPAPYTLQSLANAGYVDAQFPTIASHANNLEWLNLRESLMSSPVRQL
ncbi:amino acid kinase family protein [Planctomicrobium sp. SH527]|uniref:amino acid kinase family protein n=1 Tax=Planctomicrobium sp. SH527 TaxID=3448123 RepID=UPI003F5C751F